MAKSTIMPEIQNLIPALSPEERQGLKDSIAKNGVEVGVVLWQCEWACSWSWMDTIGLRLPGS